MEIKNQVKFDMASGGAPIRIDAVQGELATRVLEASLYSSGVPLDLSGLVASVAYEKPDGTSGWYDKMPDGTSACEINGNTVRAKFEPQMVVVPGDVVAVIRIESSDGSKRAITFPFVVNVYKDPGANAEKSEDYYSVHNWDDVNSKFAEIEEILGRVGSATTYTPQDLTDPQKAQARENIGAININAVEAKLHGMTIEGYEQVESSTEILFVDVLEEAEVYEGEMMQDWGAAASSTVWDYYKLPVLPRETYKINTYTLLVARTLVLDADNNIIAKIPEARVQDPGQVMDVTLEMPESAAYLIVNKHKNYSISVEKKVEIGSDGIHFSKVTKEGNYLFGKTLVTVGDSITWGADMDAPGIAEDGTLMSYGWQIADRNGMIFHNKGVSGSTMIASTARNGFSNENGRYTKLPDNIDYLTIWFGWNDYALILEGGGTVGTIEDTDTSTYYGAYNTVLPYLINKYPTAKIGLIVPFGATPEIRQAVRDIGNKWGVGVFDNYGKGTPLFYGKEADVGVSQEAINMRRSVFQANGAHPSYAGHYELSTQIEAWLRTL